MSKITKYVDGKAIYDKDLALKYVQTIKNFLKYRAKKANAKGFVVGISSGIDSSLVYAIASSVFPENTTGVVMPIIEMTKSDLEHINDLETAFNASFERVNLTNAFESLKGAISNLDNKLAIANIKPRLRMTTLYAIAQQKNALVLGTDNEDETFIGYFTKFGDGGADLLPISRLTKGEVKFIASLLGVPSSIVDKKPSAGLWEGQTDEDELGFTYQDLDFYLNHLDDLSAIDKNLSKQTITKIQNAHIRSQHKRDPIYKPRKVK